MTLRVVQQEHRLWVDRNFPGQPAHRPLLGVFEEAGELAHIHLKAEQKIRQGLLKPDEVKALKEDAVGDIMIYLLHYCSLEGIDVEHALEVTWSEVRTRDWKRYPRNGRTE